jgi:RNA polymerase sigma factor (sigma-70 family)
MQVIDDKHLIKKVKEYSCSPSLVELISRHSGICYKIFSKFINSLEDRGRDYNELVSNKDYFIYLAVMSFKEDRNTLFSTWLGNYIRYKCLDFLNENKLNYVHQIDENQKNNFINNNSSFKYNESKALKDTKDSLFDLLSQLKDSRVRRVYHMRYFTNHPKMTWKKIGENMGVSAQTAINLHEKGKKIIVSRLYKKKLDAPAPTC